MNGGEDARRSAHRVSNKFFRLHSILRQTPQNVCRLFSPSCFRATIDSLSVFHDSINATLKLETLKAARNTSEWLHGAICNRRPAPCMSCISYAIGRTSRSGMIYKIYFWFTRYLSVDLLPLDRRFEIRDIPALLTDSPIQFDGFSHQENGCDWTVCRFFIIKAFGRASKEHCSSCIHFK